jgi:hypothetical protein
MILVTPKAAAKLLVQQIGLNIFADDTLQMKIRLKRKKKVLETFKLISYELF